eukprot:gnl/TRDRNA2_/TRDRNA2_132250_c0_seq1.p1 gnl/TRDRNA2_/TRDRNA2_132250_c0~~gnl/TRDRNA2_/TRDRNA2_132250_c0_seq1.p1  ORF type:complete len:581 (+),score=89.77 gnl/TRDRNA2_/TRDRNA2_132250_c0_seq1:3-1745(+)
MAEGAFVAHMWRDTNNPKTALKYPIPTKDVMRNKARAVNAWFDEWREKVYEFPEYENFVSGAQSIGDMSNFDRVKKSLSCAPFSHYIARFSYVYIDTGLLPAEVFQLREEGSQRCLERAPNEKPPHSVILAPCSGGSPSTPVTELQLWHAGIRDNQRPGKPCCSGIMNWNFLQCLDSTGPGAGVRTYECVILGEAPNQRMSLDNDGQIRWRGGEGCVTSAKPNVAPAVRGNPVAGCSPTVVPVGSETVKEGKYQVPASFRLRAPWSSDEAGVCGTAAGGGQGDEADITGFAVQFQVCGKEETQQIFHAKPMLGGLQVRAGDTGHCLDSGGGGTLLIYPCYDESSANYNQVWHIHDNHLQWVSPNNPEASYCVDFKEPEIVAHKKGTFVAEMCATKPGQRFRKEQVDASGSFLLKDYASEQCLINGGPMADGAAEQVLRLGPCSNDQRWMDLVDREQVQHVASQTCLDAGGPHAPILYPCHQPRAQRTQRWEIAEEAGWIRTKPGWEDNGRRRFFERCLDYAPMPPVGVVVQSCEATKKRGTRWTKQSVRVPIETELWNKASKPPEESWPTLLGADSVAKR